MLQIEVDISSNSTTKQLIQVRKSTSVLCFLQDRDMVHACRRQAVISI